MPNKEFGTLNITNLAIFYYSDKYDYTNKKDREIARVSFFNAVKRGSLDSDKLETAIRKYQEKLSLEFEKIRLQIK